MACVHCGQPLWSETYQNGYRYYREQCGTHQQDGCPSLRHSVRCEVIDAQAGKLFGTLALPQDWQAEIERRVAGFERVRSTLEERALLAERLRRLTTAYTLGNVKDVEYKNQQAEIKRRLAGLRIPELEEEISAGETVADLRALRRHATTEERHALLKGMVARVCVDLLFGRLVGVTPKSAFTFLFEQARAKNPGVTLITHAELQRRLVLHEPPIWWWWRRGRIELPVQRTFARDMLRA